MKKVSYQDLLLRVGWLTMSEFDSYPSLLLAGLPSSGWVCLCSRMVTFECWVLAVDHCFWIAFAGFSIRMSERFWCQPGFISCWFADRETCWATDWHPWKGYSNGSLWCFHLFGGCWLPLKTCYAPVLMNWIPPDLCSMTIGILRTSSCYQLDSSWPMQYSKQNSQSC